MARATSKYRTYIKWFLHGKWSKHHIVDTIMSHPAAGSFHTLCGRQYIRARDGGQFTTADPAMTRTVCVNCLTSRK